MYKLSNFQKCMTCLTVIILLLTVGVIGWKWNSLPQKVPSHYNFAGDVDAWSSKGSILLLPIIEVVLSILLFIVSYFPKLWNMPVKVTEENKERIYKRSRDMLCTLNFLLVCVFGYMSLSIVYSRQLNALFTPISLIAVFGCLIGYCIALQKDAKQRKQS